MQRNIEWIEVCRTLGMGLVVAIHAFEFAATKQFKADNFLAVTLFSEFIRFVVPMFFFISGFLLQQGRSSSDKPLAAGAFWKKKFGALVVPFLVWNAIYILSFAMLTPGGTVFTSRNLYLLFTGFMHLYYVFVLLQFFLIYSLISRFLVGRNITVFLAGAAICSLGVYSVSEGLL